MHPQSPSPSHGPCAHGPLKRCTSPCTGAQISRVRFENFSISSRDTLASSKIPLCAPDPVTVCQELVRKPCIERRFEKRGVSLEVHEVAGLPTLFHRVKGRIKDVNRECGNTDRECRRSGGSPCGQRPHRSCCPSCGSHGAGSPPHQPLLPESPSGPRRRL